ncbi:MAG: ABC transporter ATP-binding protein [Opitutales bacterium]
MSHKDSGLAVHVEGLSKAYRIGEKKESSDTLVGSILGVLRHPFEQFRKISKLNTFRSAENDEHTLWAVRDLSFKVRRGEVLGVVGHNGAGKSTLLKLLSRITEPTSGRIEIRGRVASLLEVGTGFHPELTGRENIYLNGTILGMKKQEIDQKLDAMIEFSGIEKFIDTPIKRYSSGMKVRLAFSVAAHLDPEILIIDEVLAVGDMDFRRKSMERMREVASSGSTVLLVSHNLQSVRELCDRSMFLEAGRMVMFGETSQVLEAYLDSSKSRFRAERLGSGESFVEENRIHSAVMEGESLCIELIVLNPTNLNLGITVYDEQHRPVMSGVASDWHESFRSGRFEVTIPLNFDTLAQGAYHIEATLWAKKVKYQHEPTIARFDVEPKHSFERMNGTYRASVVLREPWEIKPL